MAQKNGTGLVVLPCMFPRLEVPRGLFCELKQAPYVVKEIAHGFFNQVWGRRSGFEVILRDTVPQEIKTSNENSNYGHFIGGGAMGCI